MKGYCISLVNFVSPSESLKKNSSGVESLDIRLPPGNYSIEFSEKQGIAIQKLPGSPAEIIRQLSTT